MSSRERQHLFDAIDKRRFGPYVCFLCGCRLGSKNRTEEHVFPKWLQTRFCLHNKNLVLLNGTSIPYKQLTIPCCKHCNNKHLAPIENTVKLATSKGANAVKALNPVTLFLWLGKILYGLLYREYLLKMDRRSASSRPIVPREVLKRFRLHQIFLQACRVPFRFVSPAGVGVPPASILVVRTQQPCKLEHQFDFRDSPFGLLVSIRMGKVGIIAALQDGGALDLIGPPKCQKYALHPIQFNELVAMMFYKASLLNRTPKFVVAHDRKGTTVMLSPLSGLSSRPVFEEWIHADYANFLAAVTGLPKEEIFYPPRVITWLRGNDGKLAFIDVDNDPMFR